MKVTIKDVAKEANVATSTVSRVLSNSPKISEESKEKVHEAIKKLVAFQLEIIAEIGLEKMDYPRLEVSEDFYKEIEKQIKDDLDAALRIKDKKTKYERIDEIKENIISKYKEDNEEIKPEELKELLAKVEKVFEEVKYAVFRRIVVNEKIRPDGRKMDEIRPLSCGIDYLPRTHGSALFTRGETQSLSVTTLGALGEHQILDGLQIEEEKRFMLHYNFPQFSVGETGRYGSPGRREIGHGALGERALLQVIPSEEEFPYTIRVVSEILESNGSSSQASICAGCLSLMAAGVPIKAPVEDYETY